MADKTITHELDPDLEETITLEDAKALVANAERRGYVIRRPKNPHNLALIRQAVHAVIAERLTQARNASKLNNDKINRLMVDQYMMRKRSGKAWTFTNAMSTRTIYLPDEEEVEMLAKILKIAPETIGIHLALIPWAMADQQARREARKRTRPSRKRPSAPPRKPSVKTRQEKDMQPSEIANNKAAEQDGPPDRVDPRPIRPIRATLAREQAVERHDIPMNAGDIKISHSGGNVRVTGKVWCTIDVAQKLRMIVPLKLINQAKGDDPWCYEINGPVHGYQLYNLMHVLYGAPRVTAVQMD